MTTDTKTRPAVKRTRPRGYIETYRPQAKTQALLDDVLAVLGEYEDQWPISGRQIFYILHAHRGYPKTDTFYTRLSEHIANARRGRVIPFEAIRDDGISVIEPKHYVDEEHFYQSVRAWGKRYRRDKLAHQDHHIEVWCEAAGMVPQLSRVAAPFSVSVYSCSGFDSLSAKYALAKRICEMRKPAKILHLGDFDPDGESIFTAIAEDVRAFVLADRQWATIDVEFVRVALTDHQVRAFDLPTVPPKATSSRTKGWRHDRTCQLEALPPDVLADILADEIEAYFDLKQLRADRVLEQTERVHIAFALPAASGNGSRG